MARPIPVSGIHSSVLVGVVIRQGVVGLLVVVSFVFMFVSSMKANTNWLGLPEIRGGLYFRRVRYP
jgi:hypothetical protein